jgi:hypothetical protein
LLYRKKTILTGMKGMKGMAIIKGEGNQVNPGFKIQDPKFTSAFSAALRETAFAAFT